MKQKVLGQYWSSPHPVYDETKKFWIYQYLHLTQYTMKQKVLDQHLHLTHKMLQQKFNIVIYIKSGILKLEKH